jgi:hypothetical protein
MSDFERLQRDRVDDADEQRDRARGQRAPFGAHARDDHDGEQRGGEQARQRGHAVDGERATAPQVGQNGNRRALDQRAAVDGCETQELRQLAMQQRVEGRLRLGFVVAPGKTDEPEPREGSAAGERCERA